MGVADANAFNPAQAISFLQSNIWHGRIFDGTWAEPPNGIIDIIEPATGDVLGQAGLAGAKAVEDAAGAAAVAQAEWVSMPPRDRAEIFRKAAKVFEDNFDEFALWIARETGAILPKGQHEVREAITILHLAAGQVLQPQGTLLPSTPGRLSYARRVPHGVVGVISPFNFPLVLSIRNVAPALAMGNAVIVKPDPRTPVTGGFLIARAFEEAGLPHSLLHILPGGADVGEAICIDPRISVVCFTGSEAVGRRIGELAGKSLKKVSLELGGKNVLIVLDDADLDRAASNAAWGAYLHQGQICMAAGRILVHESIAADLTARLVEKAKHLPVGNPATGQVALGPIINANQVERIKTILNDTIAQGAVLEAGGTHEGLFFKPTVLSNVRPGMRAFDEEVFGPVASIVTFKSDEEAVAMTNSTDGRLAVGIISKSVGRANAIGERVKAGMVHVNDQTVNDECVNPFGGYGTGSNGSSVGGPADIDLYTDWQWVTVKDTPPMFTF